MPLAGFTRYEPMTVPLVVNHQGQFPVTTVSFNLAPDASLVNAVREIDGAKQELGVPPSVQTDFQGTPRRSSRRWPTSRSSFWRRWVIWHRLRKPIAASA